MSKDKKTIILIAAVPVVFLLLIFMATKVKFDLSLSPIERKLLNFSEGDIPKIVEREKVAMKQVRSPVEATSVALKDFPGTPLAALLPPISASESRVSLILVNNDRKMAVIDGKFVNEGDLVDKHKIVKIERNKILLKSKEGEKWLKLD